MPRILCSATVGWLVLAATGVGAQQPGGAATAPRSTVVARATPARSAAPKILPGTRPGVFSTIQGNALNSTNGSLPNANVRLRNARIGHIVDTQVTDRSGIFAFRAVDPGSYIVEVVDLDRTSVLAASQILNVGPGETVSAVVKLPFRIPLFTGVLGNTTPSAALVTAEAGAAGVLALQISGAPTCPGPTN